MRILVTGGAGFIGSAIARKLIALDHEVAIVDDLSAGSPRSVPDRADFFVRDVRSDAMNNIFATFEPWAVVHQAALASVRESVDRPARYASVNVEGTVALLELCRRFEVGTFVFASTGGAIYGDESCPARECDLPRPLSPYGVSKLAAEAFIEHYRRDTGMRAISLRYGNVYGPGQRGDGEAGVVAIFLEAMANGRAPRITGDGLQTRDFVHVDDVVAANMVSLFRDIPGGVYNVGTGVETSILSLFSTVSAVCGWTGGAYHVDPARGEQRRSALDSWKLRSFSDWRPRVALADGIAATFEAVRSEAA